MSTNVPMNILLNFLLWIKSLVTFLVIKFFLLSYHVDQGDICANPQVILYSVSMDLLPPVSILAELIFHRTGYSP